MDRVEHDRKTVGEIATCSGIGLRRRDQIVDFASTHAEQTRCIGERVERPTLTVEAGDRSDGEVRALRRTASSDESLAGHRVSTFEHAPEGVPIDDTRQATESGSRSEPTARPLDGVRVVAPCADQPIRFGSDQGSTAVTLVALQVVDDCGGNTRC